LEAEMEKDKANIELEKERMWHRIEQMRIESRVLGLDNEPAEESHVNNTQGRVQPRVPKLPVFDEVHDEMDSYLLRFERYSAAQNWDESNWAINLSALLKGKALDVYALTPRTDALDY
jgi:hypothetical protein